MSSIIYGPVPSWRLGRSLGVDLLSSSEKICSFDCIYCQLGETGEKTGERKIYVETAKVGKELVDVVDRVRFDTVTFSGTGEPTLAANLGNTVKVVKEYTDKQVAVLTNSSLMYLEEVRRDLSLADFVVAKLDAPDSKILRKINRPIEGLTFDAIIAGLMEFRSEFKGKLALQVMLIDENKSFIDEFIKVIRDLKPDEVQVNTPLRPCSVKPLPQKEIMDIAQKLRNSLKGIKVLSVYEEKRPEVKPMDEIEVSRRRPNEARRYFEFYQKTFGREMLKKEADYLRRFLKEEDRILDVGCGPGIFEKELSGYNIKGIDLNSGMIEIAREICDNEFTVGSAENLPFKDNSFDCLMYLFSIEFIEDYRKAIDEAVRVLSADGRIIVLLLNSESIDYKEKVARGQYIEKNIKHKDTKKIKDYIARKFIIEEEYFLGVKGEKIFDTKKPRYASVYALKGELR